MRRVAIRTLVFMFCFALTASPQVQPQAKFISFDVLGTDDNDPCAAQSLSNGKGDLRVMTYNVDEGTDYLEILQAKSTMEFLLAVGQTITQVRATNPPARMQGVAKQIVSAGPMLVRLQDLDQWFTGPFNPMTGVCGPQTLEFDMVQELKDALASQGANYEVAVQAQQYIFPPTPGLIPSTGAFLCVSVVNNVATCGDALIPSGTCSTTSLQKTPETLGHLGFAANQ
jgi:hypothetical protein